ncbi:MAG: exosortase system-associated protein, TIGR04073 family [Victivallales bacterium]|nr:exosortase system-associated protein, TIGR04073 family [Victivallales bacterium]
MTCLSCVTAQAQDEELFDLNTIIVKGELYVWNRISDALDLFRCGIGGGGDIGFDIALTEYAQLGAMVTKERGVDFPHFIPPFWMAHYYQQKPIFQTHEGYCATVAFGPWRKESVSPEEAIVHFGRDKWDIRLEAAIIAHLYINIDADEIGDFLAGFVGWDPKHDDQEVDVTVSRRPADQFGRGICNILFGVLEVPFNIIRVNEEEGDMAGISKGLGLGVWRFLVREVVGVVELVTFPFGWSAIIEPEYPVQKSKNSIWSVRRPSFHKRY